MQPEKPDDVQIPTGQGSKRLLCRGFILYLVSAVLIPAVCYVFGWRTLQNLGAGYLYGAVFLVIFGLCMVAGNLMPLQLSNVKDVTLKSEPVRYTPLDKTGPAPKGVMLLTTTLIGAALLGLTGGFIKLIFGG